MAGSTKADFPTLAAMAAYERLVDRDGAIAQWADATHFLWWLRWYGELVPGLPCRN